MLPLISVIIPVYKVEDYLRECVQSVLDQTYRNIEIILIDDGSPDKCPLICDNFAMRDTRIQVIHKENGGLASARNVGIDIAKGEYLAFIDSDDLWSPCFLERLYQAIQETDADFAVCQFQRFQKEPKKNSKKVTEALSYSQEEAFECLFGNRNENMVVAPNKLYKSKLFGSTNENMVVTWNKLYQTNLFNVIRYPEGKLHEDEAVIHEIIGASEKIAWLDEVHYYYRWTPDSITTSKFSIKRLDEIEAKERRIVYFETRGMNNLADRTKIVYLNNLMRLYRTVQHNIKDKISARQIQKDLYRKYISVYRKELVRNESLKFRIRCRLFILFPNMYSAVEYIRLNRKGYND